ncbi:unnamed protein product [Triticum turgidum subsp. durum]|uniref:Uncharacterized protein n=1 Tax=Triticum turgidum subsp. durum TaxID=4567 RepID=A0A9R0TK03_TRITD|nr:unnamed protein product [Triticum turgidum subsp. durum]
MALLAYASVLMASTAALILAVPVTLLVCTVYAAAYLGHALAMHRLRAGAISGNAVPVRRVEGEATTTRRIAVTAFWATASAVAIEAVVFRVFAIDGIVTVFFLSAMGCMYAAVCNILVVSELMGGALFQEWMPLFLLACSGCWVVSLLLVVCIAICPFMVAGAVTAALCMWVLMFALLAFLVYMSYLHTCAAVLTRQLTSTARDDDWEEQEEIVLPLSCII